MDIKQKDIDDFKELYVRHFNISLSDGMARTKLCMLVRQAEIVYQPLSRREHELAKNINKNTDEQRPSRSSRIL